MADNYTDCSIGGKYNCFLRSTGFCWGGGSTFVENAVSEQQTSNIDFGFGFGRNDDSGLLSTPVTDNSC